MSGSASRAWESDSDSGQGMRAFPSSPRRFSRSALLTTSPPQTNPHSAALSSSPPTSSPRKRKRHTPFPPIAPPSPSSHGSALLFNHLISSANGGMSDSPSLSTVDAADNESEATRELIIDDAIDQGWLRNVMDTTIGPCVALAYEVQDTPTGTSHPRYTPLRSSWGRNWSKDTDDLSDQEDDYTDAWPMTGVTRVQARATLEQEIQRPPPKQKHLATAAKTSDLAISKLTVNPDRSVLAPQANVKTCKFPLFDTKNIPLEIFENIIKFLSRSDVKNMRLVDRAFERGVSAQMFGTVVVPFNTEIYGMLATCQETDGRMRISDCKGHVRADVTDLEPHDGRLGKALDIFRGFGPHIRRYGMSFEVQEQELACPPNKSDRQDHAAYWGKYTWPYPQYRRFADRADLEITADETSTMKRAFSHLKRVQHLALTLDCGLGWLNGADMSLRGSILRRNEKIFGESNYSTHADVIAQRHLWTTLEDSYDEVAALEELKFAELLRIEHPGSAALMRTIHPRAFHPLPSNLLQQLHSASVQAGASGDSQQSNDNFVLKEVDLDDGDDDMLGLDHFVRLANLNPSVEHYSLLRSRRARRSLSTSFVGRDRNYQASNRYPRNEEAVAWPYRLHLRGSSSEAVSGDAEEVDEQRTMRGSHQTSSNTETIPPTGVLLTRRFKIGSRLSGSPPERHPKINSLNPRNLTRSQKEWLLESKWAQDAFLSSYMLAISDNHETFGNVQSLTLSRFSSRHLPKLIRPDFWKALPSLSVLNLEIIADWRDVEKDQTGYAADTSIDPSLAASNTYRLLRERVSSKKSIKILSFGWADGGEHAEGLHARNKHILPAPIFHMNSALIPDNTFADLLVFPNVEHLILTNCWLTPNALRCFVSAHGSQQLKKFTLDSVSITTHPRFNRQNGNNAVPAQPFALMNLPQNFNAFAAQNLAVPPHGLALANGQTIWPNVHIQTQQQQFLIQQQLQQMQQHMQQLLQLQQPPPNQNSADIREGSWADVLDYIRQDYLQAGNSDTGFTFLSCGYVRMRGVSFDQSVLENAALEQDSEDLVTSRNLGAFLAERLESLSCVEMVSRDMLLASVATAMPAGEMETLRTTWGLRPGWPSAAELGPAYDNEDGWGKWGWRSKQAAEYDGARPGGTGRFSGKLTGFVELDDKGRDFTG